MRRSWAVTALAVALVAGGAVAGGGPATAASENAWQVTAFYSRAGWKDTKPKAPILRACTSGANPAHLALGSPIAVMNGDEVPIGTGTVTKVTLWKQVGKWICKFSGAVAVPANTESMYLVQVGQTASLFRSRGQVRRDGWRVDYWPR